MFPIKDSLYLADFSVHALWGVLRPQKIKLPTKPIAFRQSFYFTTETLHQWNKIYNLPNENTDVPFAFYWKVMEKYFLGMMSRLGVNFKNVLHLAHERTFPISGRNLEVGRVYRLEGRIRDICLLDRDRIVLVSESLIKEPNGETICLGFDYIYVRNVTHKSIQEIKNHPNFNNHVVSNFINLKKRVATLPESTPSERMFFSDDIGLRYGFVSGDLNPIHINRPLARLFGHKEPFAQGTCIANYALKLLTHDRRETIRDFRMTFTRPVTLGQSAVLRLGKTEFELFDRNNHLVAFGERTHHDV